SSLQHELEMKVPITLSHVCNRWRAVILNMPSQWTFLEMHNTRYPEIFTDFISRSKRRLFVLTIKLPYLDTANGSIEDQKEFKETFSTLRKNIVRLRGLHVESNNATLFLIFNKLLKRVDFPQLQFLTIHQEAATARRYTLGPLALNPAHFTRLFLKNIMIECDAPCLAGLRMIRLINSSGSLLDQTRLIHPKYPQIPKEPIMMNLNELVVDGTYLIPATGEFTPSFRASSLRSLVLAHISTNTPQTLESVNLLFDITYSQRLESLVCVGLDTAAFRVFVRMTMASPEPKFPCVRNLVLADVDVGDVTASFLQSFPAIVSFTIHDTRPNKILLYLTAHQIMPLLHSLYIDGRRILRPRLPN
ncbi:hypothetical protein C0991_002852, partial [Blastosporella zonata]